MENRENILKGLEKAYKKLVAFKKYKKSPMIIMKDGKVIEIPYEEIRTNYNKVYKSLDQ